MTSKGLLIALVVVVAFLLMLAAIGGTSESNHDDRVAAEEEKLPQLAASPSHVSLAESTGPVSQQHTKALTENAAATVAPPPPVVASPSPLPKGVSCKPFLAHHPAIAIALQRQHLVDVAAVRDPAESLKSEFLKWKRIPMVVHQLAAREQVPEGMREAMETIARVNPWFEYRYTSDHGAAEYMRDHMKGTEMATAFERLIPRKMRADIFTMSSLAKDGGVHIHPAFVAVGDTEGLTRRRNLVTIVSPDDDFVVAAKVAATGRLQLTLEFLASTAGHPILEKALSLAVKNVEKGVLGEQAESVTGDDVLTAAFKEVMGKANIELGSFSGPSGIGKVKVVEYRAPATACDATGAVLEVQRSGEPAVVFETRYLGYSEDMSWYHLQMDDYDSEVAWRTKQVFLPKVAQEKRCPFGLVADMEKDATNVQPESRRALLDISAFHPIIKPSLAHQAIPRIIVQTHKRDRIPRAMQQNVLKLIELNPEYEHYFYSERKAREYIKVHFNKKVLDAFDALLPGPMRGELFKLCFLQSRGGVVVDADMVPVRPLRQMIGAQDEFVASSSQAPPKANGDGFVFPGLLAAKARNQVVNQALNLAVDSILRKEHGGPDPSVVLGGSLMGRAFNSEVRSIPKGGKSYSGSNAKLLVYDADPACASGRLILDGGSKDTDAVLFYTRYPTYIAEMRWYNKDDWDVETLWKSKRVYR